MIKKLILTLAILLVASPAFSADYAANQTIDTLADVSAAITGATIVPIQDMNDTDKTGRASIQQVVNKGMETVIRTAVGAADYNPSALTDDYIIAMTDTAAARAVTISTEDRDSGTTAKPRVIIVKDESGGAAAHNITISLETAGNIDRAANYVLNQNYQSITLYIDGTNAWIY